MTKVGGGVTAAAVDRPVLVTGFVVLVSVALIVLAGAPSLWPEALPFLHAVKVDTDPENMLREDEPVRVFHDRMKKTFSLYDMVVVGVVNEDHPEGVFNPASLRRVYDLTAFAKTLRWPKEDDPEAKEGVVAADVIAPSTVDNIEQAGLGTVRFEWLMPTPPETQEAAEAVRAKAKDIPFLDGTLVSDDGKALALYLPLTRKDLAHRVSTALEGKIADFDGPEDWHITGLPVAEDTFGVEMFKQMAISAPLAMLVIFVLLFVFFRKFLLIVQPLILAMVSVIWTMGLLVATGQTIHIMSSMIPIFIMPIAVLDSVHILSEFFDRYQETRDRRETIVRAMHSLFRPMLYTSLTTAAGFASLALTPIPPVQVFGVFVALGVMVAWALTITFIPATIMFIPERYLANFGLKRSEEEAHDRTPISRFLRAVGRGTYRFAPLILVGTAVCLIVAGYGINLIGINDNPTKWFEYDHPIRVADRVLNRHFGGTYMAYLELEPAAGDEDAAAFASDLAERLRARGKALEETYPAAPDVFDTLAQKAEEPVPLEGHPDGVRTASPGERLARLSQFAEKRLDEAEGEKADAWDRAALFIGERQQQRQTFKQPEVLRRIRDLQDHLLETGVVGKSNSLTDIVRTVYRELMGGEDEHFRVPEKPAAVAQCLIQYESSHRPQDLAHFVTRDEADPSAHFRKSCLWVQLKSGDNRDMEKVVAAVDRYMDEQEGAVRLDHRWFGLTYINVVWQDKMVRGLLTAFLGSFLVVLLMMMILFRSGLWGLLSMIPLTVTVAMIYGIIGLVGKDYDMPVAVLSSLTLGLAVDYAIHFLARSRELRDRHGSWKEAVPHVFGEPARAITRNVVVVGVGFLPLLAAPLVPYQTVGVFMAAILVLAGVASLLILPALIRVLRPLVFPETRACCITCNCGTCIVAAATAVGL
ncbi:MAG: MMPL family transporter, partial [Phycisphaerae bacterium]